jgi:hypothetical protein
MDEPEILPGDGEEASARSYYVRVPRSPTIAGRATVEGKGGVQNGT